MFCSAYSETHDDTYQQEQTSTQNDVWSQDNSQHGHAAVQDKQEDCPLFSSTPSSPVHHVRKGRMVIRFVEIVFILLKYSSFAFALKIFSLQGYTIPILLGPCPALRKCVLMY